jgi:sec-independent protein translocase protein TatB
MFDIGFFEILLIGVIALLILGPKRLPGFLTKLEEYVKLIRSKGASISQEIKQEIYSEDFENKEKNKDD